MSATTAPTTFSDLYTDLINRVRQATGVTATNNIAKRYINVALLDCHLGFREKFAWAERTASLRLHAAYSTGTVSITQGSTSLTGSSTLWNTANAFAENNARTTGRICINGMPEIYGVSAVGSDTALTLETKYIGATVSGGSYVYFEDEYALASDFLRPIDQQFFDQSQDIKLIGRREFRLRYPRNNIIGKPRVATIVDRPPSGNTTPVRRIVFYQPPNDVELITYNYITSNLAVSSAGAAQAALSADDDEPIVPIHCRHAITFHALYHWYRDQKDDARSAEAKQEYTDIMLRISSDHEVGQNRPMIRPRVGMYKRGASRPMGRGRGRYTTGSSFDEFR